MTKFNTTYPSALINHVLSVISCSFLDVLLKNGIIAFCAFRIETSGNYNGMLATLTWSLYIAPFFLMSAFGSYLADRYQKRNTVLWLRVIDVIIACLAAYGFISANVVLLLSLMFIKGISSALFAPLKYALLSEVSGAITLTTAATLLETSILLALLAGTYVGTVYGAHVNTYLIGLIAISCTCIAGFTSYWLPKSATNKSNLTVRYQLNPLTPLISTAFKHQRCFACIIALSWYWALGAVFLANIALLVKTFLHGDEHLLAEILLIFVSGIGCGSGLGCLFSQGRSRYKIPLMLSIIIGLAGLDLVWSVNQSLLKLSVDFFILAMAAGCYSVYYSSILHFSVDAVTKANIFAAYNMLNSLVAIMVLLAASQLISYDIPVPLCLAGFAIATLPITIFANRLLTKY